MRKIILPLALLMGVQTLAAPQAVGCEHTAAVVSGPMPARPPSDTGGHALANNGAAPAKPVPAMTNGRLLGLIKRLDPHPQGRNSIWQFQVAGKKVLAVTDWRADRVQIMTTIPNTGKISRRQLLRLMQANFDSTLDARYAVALDKVWSVYLHPFRSLTEAEFFSGVSQVVSLVETFGDTYTAGQLMFRGGDSPAIEEERYQRSLDLANSI